MVPLLVHESIAASSLGQVGVIGRLFFFDDPAEQRQEAVGELFLSLNAWSRAPPSFFRSAADGKVMAVRETVSWGLSGWGKVVPS